MKRRQVILAAAALAVAPQLRAQAEKMRRLGILSTSRAQTAEELARSPFLIKLRDLGWVEGRNLRIERRNITAASELPQAARELAALKLDVVYAIGGPSISIAKQEITGIPIVIFSVGDPIRAGHVKSLARPEGNITGVAGFARDLASKRVALLKETVPRMKRAALLGNPAQPMLKETVPDLLQRARAIGVELRLFEIANPAALEPAFAAMAREAIDGLIELPDPMLHGQIPRIVELAARYRLPAIHERREFAEGAGLMAYGADYDELARSLAVYIDRILKGAKPGDLPIEQPTKFELVINLKTAKALGLKIPQSVLLRADRVIE